MNFRPITLLLRLLASSMRTAASRLRRLRRVGRLIRAFETELPTLAEVRRIIEELPRDGGKKLLMSDLTRVRGFRARCGLWPRLSELLLQSGVPPTNNATEQAPCPDRSGIAAIGR